MSDSIHLIHGDTHITIQLPPKPESVKDYGDWFADMSELLGAYVKGLFPVENHAYCFELLSQAMQVRRYPGPAR